MSIELILQFSVTQPIRPSQCLKPAQCASHSAPNTYTSFFTSAESEVQGTVGPGIQRAEGAQARSSRGPEDVFPKVADSQTVNHGRTGTGGRSESTLVADSPLGRGFVQSCTSYCGPEARGLPRPSSGARLRILCTISDPSPSPRDYCRPRHSGASIPHFCGL